MPKLEYEKKNFRTDALEVIKQAESIITQYQAQEIIDIIWPEARAASPAEVFKAVSICEQYGLNPLMKHVYLIPFNKKEKRGNEWVVVGTNYTTPLPFGDRVWQPSALYAHWGAAVQKLCSPKSAVLLLTFYPLFLCPLEKLFSFDKSKLFYFGVISRLSFVFFSRIYLDCSTKAG